MFIYGVVKFVLKVCVGLLFVVELDVFGKVLDNFKCLMVVIVGGFKVFIKLIVLKILVEKVD